MTCRIFRRQGPSTCANIRARMTPLFLLALAFGWMPGLGLAQWSINPSPVDFQQVVIDRPSPAPGITAFVRNQTGSSQTITGLGFVTPIPAFSIVNDGCTNTLLLDGQSCQLTLRFQPDALGSFEAWIQFSGANVPGSLQVLGEGVPPQVSISPSSLQFGDVPVGVTSQVLAFTITNTATSDDEAWWAEVTDIIHPSAIFDHVGGTCPTPPFDLPGGFSNNSCTAEYTFTPPDAQTYNAPVQFDFNGLDVIELWVFGTGAGAVLTVDPFLVDFGTVDVGDFEQVWVELGNAGTEDLSISAIAAPGQSSPVSLLQDECNPPLVLIPGADCQQLYRFTPTQPGTIGFALSVTSNTTGTVQEIAFTGQAVAPSSPPELVISPAIVDFGLAPTNDLAPQQFTTLSNAGTETLDVTAISSPTPGSGFIEFPLMTGACGNPPFSIAGGDSCQLYFGFAAPSSGPHADQILVDSNTTGPAPSPIDLVGEGVDVFISLGQPLVEFGDIEVGSTGVATLTLNNEDNGHPSGDGFPLRVDNLYGLAHANWPPWLQLEPGTCGPLPFDIDYLDSCELEFHFTPPATGPFNHDESVISNAIGQTDFVIEGTGVASAPPVLTMIPAPDPVTGATMVDFGAVMQGDSATSEVTLRNDGGSDLTFSISISVISQVFSVDASACDPGGGPMLAPGEECQALFLMHPPSDATPGSASMGYDVVSNAASSPDGIQVSGEIVEQPLFWDRFEQ